MMAKSIVISLVVCLTLISTTFAKEIRFIDDDGIESIAQSFCDATKGTHRQIGRLSTIHQLKAYFKDLSPNHKLYQCRELYSNALNQLYGVITVSPNNVCSEEKMGLISHFHHNFVSGTWVDRSEKKEAKKHTPELLVLFFLHYAHQVSATCKESLMAQFAPKQEAQLLPQKNQADQEKADELLREFSAKFGATSSQKGYADIMNVWTLVDRLPRVNKEGNAYVMPRWAQKRVAFKARDTEPVRKFQSMCLQKLKPLYGPLALPVIQLIDMGYYLEGEPFARFYAQSQDLRRVIQIAQLCEFMVQVRVIKDETLTDDQMVLITRKEAEHVPDLESKESTLVVPPEADLLENRLRDDDVLTTANTIEAGDVVKSLKANIKARGKVSSRILHAMVKQAGKKVKSLVGKIFYTDKNEKRDATPVINESMNELKVEESHETGATGLSRKKRSLSKDMENLSNAFSESFFIGVILIFGLIIKWFFQLLWYTIGAPILALFCVVFIYPFNRSKGLEYCSMWD